MQILRTSDNWAIEALEQIARAEKKNRRKKKKIVKDRKDRKKKGRCLGSILVICTDSGCQNALGIVAKGWV